MGRLCAVRCVLCVVSVYLQLCGFGDMIQQNAKNHYSPPPALAIIDPPPSHVLQAPVTDIELSDREVRGLLLIFLHIVKSCNQEVVRDW